MLFQVLQAVGLDSAAAEMAEDMAQGAAPVADLAPQQVEQSFSLIEMATKGGWLMIVRHLHIRKEMVDDPQGGTG